MPPKSYTKPTTVNTSIQNMQRKRQATVALSCYTTALSTSPLFPDPLQLNLARCKMSVKITTLRLLDGYSRRMLAKNSAKISSAWHYFGCEGWEGYGSQKYLGNVVVSSLSLLFLQLNGYASHRPSLNPLHEVRHESKGAGSMQIMEMARTDGSERTAKFADRHT